MAIEKPNLKVLGNVSFIVIGVIIASYGELKFVFIGFLFQAFGIIFEATRLVMVQRLLNSPEYKMDPLVSLYYFAPVCAVMNFLMFMVFEFSKIELSDFGRVGIVNLILNASVAFGLNVSVVFLVSTTMRILSRQMHLTVPGRLAKRPRLSLRFAVSSRISSSSAHPS